MTTNPILNVTELSKTFTIHHRGGTQLEAFNDVNFTVHEGEALALSGPSGAGKSSIMKCIYRSYIPTGGSIIYRSAAGEALDLTHVPERLIDHLRRHEMGYISQFLRVLPRVPAKDVVAEPLLEQGIELSEARDRACALLDRLNIPAKLHNAFPTTFSGGEQQRVNIARGIIRRPRLLLMDEPTASLDKGTIDIALSLFDEMKQQGTAFVMIFHDPALIERLADTVHTVIPRSLTHAYAG